MSRRQRFMPVIAALLIFASTALPFAEGISSSTTSSSRYTAGGGYRCHDYGSAVDIKKKMFEGGDRATSAASYWSAIERLDRPR
jgi:hypothetical protein